MHKILVIRLYFTLNALHISYYISPSSGATFCKLYIAFGICRYRPVPYVWLLFGYSHTTARRMVPAYTKCDVQLIKVYRRIYLIRFIVSYEPPRYNIRGLLSRFVFLSYISLWKASNIEKKLELCMSDRINYGLLSCTAAIAQSV